MFNFSSGGDEGVFLSEREEAYFSGFAGMFKISNIDRYFLPTQKGSMPIPVLKNYKKGLDRIAKDPRRVFLEKTEVTREKIAKGYGARADEIAITRNTTDAISQVLYGIDWSIGDEILCSTLEYPNCIATIRRVACRFGLTVRQFGVPSRHDTHAEEIVESARRGIVPGKTKVMFFSAPAQPNGMMLPFRRLARLAQHYGIITVVDGAHYGGMFNPRLDDTGIDFWGISGYKWQCGPGGTGILYVRNALLESNNTPLPRFNLVRSADLQAPIDGSRPLDFDIGAALSHYGFPESADLRALGEACEIWDRAGRERIERYILWLADYAREKLAAVFGEYALLQACRDAELKSGLVAFNPFPEKEQRRDLQLAHRFNARLSRKYGYRLGYGGIGLNGFTRDPEPDAGRFYEGCVPNRNALTNEPEPEDIPFRFGTPVWINRKDIDRFIKACRKTLDSVA